MLPGDTGLNSRQTFAESREEISNQRVSNPVILFGRQVFPMKTQCLKLHKREFDLQLPADQCIYRTKEEFPRTFNLWDHLRETTEFQNSGAPFHFKNPVESELSLSPGLKSKAKDDLQRNWLGKRTLQTVIDLEEPAALISLDRETEGAASLSHVAPVPYFGRKLESEISEVVKKDQSYLDEEKCRNKQEFFNQGLKVCDDNKECTNISTLKQQFPSRVHGILDLNEIPIDEPVLDLENGVLYDLNHPYTEDTQVSGEKSEVEDPTTPFGSPKSQNIREKDVTRSPASYTSCCVTDNGSRPESRSSSPPSSNQISLTRVESQVSEISSSDKKEDSHEIDPSVQMAATSLIRFSFNYSEQNQEFSTQARSGSTKAEYSCDSYEILTLELTETSPDDYCISSKLLDEGNNTANNNDSGFKLRRGRRMKNFQKEILPGLVSLTRHEIREDVNILEAVLRSREYKKIQAKAGQKSWCTPVKNKRSRSTAVGRRRKSK